jgi:hypothetical protein
MATFRRCTWVAFLALGLVTLGTWQTAQAQVVWIGTTDDVLDGANWVGGVVPTTAPAAIQEARFGVAGSHTPNLTADWNLRYIGWDDASGALPRSVAAPVTLTISTNSLEEHRHVFERAM